jgi:diketogulonate reductase-like aldo/keto reductase
MLNRTIPSSGEQLPVIGLGTWQTFDVNSNQQYPTFENILRTMHAAGGALIDSSPMYGHSESVIGELTQPMDISEKFFYATKVWTNGRQEGIRQMETSMQRMQRNKMDLIQIHNLVDWQTHLHVLRRWKEEGKIRYIGITHYTNSSHGMLEQIMRSEQIDFVQFNYSIIERDAEIRLLDAAADLGVATIINRPLGTGRLFSKVHGRSLTEWAKEYGIDTWTAYFLKYIIGHPAVTCVIPATANASHAKDNFKAGNDVLPNQAVREKMLAYLKQL